MNTLGVNPQDAQPVPPIDYNFNNHIHMPTHKPETDRPDDATSKLQPTDPLEEISLPDSIHLPSTTAYSQPEKQPPRLSEPNIIRYRVTDAIAQAESTVQANANVKETLRRHWDWERKHVFDIEDTFATILKHTGPYLRSEIRDPLATFAAELRDIKANREWWYQEYLPQKIEKAIENSKDVAFSHSPTSALIVSEDTYTTLNNGPPSRYLAQTADGDRVIPESQLKTGVVPSDCGFPLPLRFLTMPSSSRGSHHVFIPWGGGLHCSCEFATQNSNIMCKHEAALLINAVNWDPNNTLSVDQAAITGPRMHPRFTRIMPHIRSTAFHTQFAPRLQMNIPTVIDDRH